MLPFSQKIARWGSRTGYVQTGQILEIKPRTVAFHLDNARAKLEAENVTHTVALALKRGLIP